MNKLALPKGKKVAHPTRECDYISKRGVKYWWGPEWVRDLHGTIGRIVPMKKYDFKGQPVWLYMLSKDGNLTFIQGSIQEEFIKWHEDNAIDYLLLGINIKDILVTNWIYE